MENPKTTRMYATKPNPRANDFNWEPEYIEVPYDVLGCSGGKCLVNRAGWDGPRHRHYIKESDLHFKK